MIHLGDITKISGYAAPVVDCVIGGSPCQDLSVAGKRAGLAGARSGLFVEQIRVIKEMREADRRAGRPANLLRPRFMLWENVPGAFSSNKGQDFRAVIEETIRIAEPDAPDIPLPRKGKWPMADAYLGDGWSVAYRVFDAQFWGVPQRRRRIALVADFRGHAAPEILFVRESLSGDFEPGAAAGEADTAGAGGCVGEASGYGETGIGYWQRGIQCLRAEGENRPSRPSNVVLERRCMAFHLTQDPITSVDCAPCLSSGNPRSGQATVGVLLFENHGQDSRLVGPLEVAPTVAQKFGTGGNNTPLVVQEQAGPGIHGEIAGTLDASYYKGPGMRAGVEREVVIQRTEQPVIVMATGQANAEICEGICPTLNCNHEAPIVMEGCLTPWDSQTIRIYGKDGAFPTLQANAGKTGLCRQSVFVDSFVRRLTPMECERLQGYPDGWTDLGEWVDSKGKVHKESSDSARYRALGNSIALPPWKWVIKRLCAQYERDATMASLFDGIGGFPLLWEQINGRGSCLWASEIEEFPIAVTKRRFA